MCLLQTVLMVYTVSLITLKKWINSANACCPTQYFWTGKGAVEDISQIDLFASWRITIPEILSRLKLESRGLFCSAPSQNITELQRLWSYLLEAGTCIRLSRALLGQIVNTFSEGKIPLLFQTICSSVYFFFPSKVLFLVSRQNFPKATCACCLLSCRCASLWKECLCFLCNYPVGIGKLWLDSPCMFSSLGWTNPVPWMILCVRVAQCNLVSIVIDLVDVIWGMDTFVSYFLVPFERCSSTVLMYWAR